MAVRRLESAPLSSGGDELVQAQTHARVSIEGAESDADSLGLVRVAAIDR
jgi:hypothetical protein